MSLFRFQLCPGHYREVGQLGGSLLASTVHPSSLPVPNPFPAGDLPFLSTPSRQMQCDMCDEANVIAQTSRRLILVPCFNYSYTKNLSSDKINLSTFRGEGELSNLELDERVLTELLELPSWLRLTSAWCNHVSFRISWTKLKSVPITLVSNPVNWAIKKRDHS